MSVGCVICSDAFSCSDGPDKNPMNIKSCGHGNHCFLQSVIEKHFSNLFHLTVFHAYCLSTWLKKSLTCPVCRNPAQDTPTYLQRIHLQSVNNLNTSEFYQPAAEDTSKKTMETVMKYVKDMKKALSHIEIELGNTKRDDDVIIVESPQMLPPTSTTASQRSLANRAFIARPGPTIARPVRSGVAIRGRASSSSALTATGRR